MRFSNVTCEQLASRDLLLQASLRASPTAYSIVDEYPIVLSPENRQYSFVLIDDATTHLIAHANLWPRRFIDRNTGVAYPIALVGNVTTHPNYRARGFSRLLIEQLSQRVQETGLCAMFLWSDLVEFYHRLGFSQWGKEYRFYFQKSFLQAYSKSKRRYNGYRGSELEPSALNKLLAGRYPVPVTLERSLLEYQRLLAIPDSVILIDEASLGNFCIIGKGQDLIGVVHEWGFENQEAMLDAICHILKITGWSEVVLLAPDSLDPTWQQGLATYASKVEEHPTALAQFFTPWPFGSKSYIWGLDSI